MLALRTTDDCTLPTFLNSLPLTTVDRWICHQKTSDYTADRWCVCMCSVLSRELVGLISGNQRARQGMAQERKWRLHLRASLKHWCLMDRQYMLSSSTISRNTVQGPATGAACAPSPLQHCLSTASSCAKLARRPSW
jgi:hypothetical protein